jgi:uncharacterized membrane protein YuzA (DUF378 family)
MPIGTVLQPSRISGSSAYIVGENIVMGRKIEQSGLIMLMLITILCALCWTLSSITDLGLKFFDVGTYNWVFSTVAQVFGTLLGILGIVIIFALDKSSNLKDKIERLRETHEGVREEGEGLRGGLREYIDRSGIF